MTLSNPSKCPRTEELSALIDGELTGAACGEMAAHAGSCPICGAMLRDLGELRDALQPLAAAHLGFDLAPVIEQCLAARRQPRREARRRDWRHGWRLLPSGLAAAGVLAAGVQLGVLLAGGAGVTAMQPAAMALFDPVPPGGLCVGIQSCYPLAK